MSLEVKRLDGALHATTAFENEESFFTDYIVKKDRALAHMRKGMNVVYVAVHPDEPEVIRGYMTLSMGQIQQDQIDEWARAGLPKFPIPVLYLGLLATDKKYLG